MYIYNIYIYIIYIHTYTHTYIHIHTYMHTYIHQSALGVGDMYICNIWYIYVFVFVAFWVALLLTAYSVAFQDSLIITSLVCKLQLHVFIRRDRGETIISDKFQREIAKCPDKSGKYNAAHRLIGVHHCRLFDFGLVSRNYFGQLPNKRQSLHWFLVNAPRTIIDQSWGEQGTLVKIIWNVENNN